MTRRTMLAALSAWAATAANAAAPAKIQVLIVSGRDDHDWRGATARMRQYLDTAGIFEVRTTEEFLDAGPGSLSHYDVVVLVFNDKAAEDHWSERSRTTLMNFVQAGKGLVIYHHTAASFKEWPEFARLSGGNYYGKAQHGPIHDFTVRFVDREHPVTRGLRAQFPQFHDELYANMQMQPSGSYHVLATAWDDHALYKGRSRAPLEGPGKDEPVMWTLEAGKGRVFATMLGHSAEATQSAGFRATFTRGVEWAATGVVTQAAPPEMAE